MEMLTTHRSDQNVLTSIVWTVAIVCTISLNSPRTLPKKSNRSFNKMYLRIGFRFREMENNKTHNSLLLTGSFSCWRKWCTKSKFFTLPLFFTKNSRTEAWVIPSFADMLNLCGKVQIIPPLLSDRRYFPPSSQLCSNACWELVKSSRACSTWLSTSGRERACVYFIGQF